MRRKHIIVKGLVQGVGFRPFVYRIAKAAEICGWVCNSGDGVTIEAEAAADRLDRFMDALRADAPSLSRIDAIICEDIGPLGETGFEIRKSVPGSPGEAIIPADLAICPDCAAELTDPSDRHFEYPFLNCTNCGPRFTIVKDLPYDRKQTTMSVFPMCAECGKEFENPEDRRFHAQPNACPACGPEIYISGRAEISPEQALSEAVSVIVRGGLAALKSLGGFHIVCDAMSSSATERLRKWKNRPAKPFAVMVDSISSAEKCCFLNEEEKILLASSSAPVVMARSRDSALSAIVAPGLASIGIMTAYTPLHLLLFRRLRQAGFTRPLVMTSGNRRDEPICIDDAGVGKTLSGLCDVVLSHNREIHNRCDDSVVFVSGGETRFIRRARGYVPGSVGLGLSGPCVIGAGAHLKNTFCITRGREAFMSQHIGDMDSAETESFYAEAIASMKRLLRVEPEIFAHDLHPEYYSTRFAAESGVRLFPVQHHFAHVASVIAEKNIPEPVIGVAFDGTGYGSDGTVWGAEFIAVSGTEWTRRGTLRPVRIPGGDAAVPEIWRSALAYLKCAYGKDWRMKAERSLRGIPGRSLDVASGMADAGVNSPWYSSMGRLFDAAACLSGLRSFASYEAQGAMELEALCRNISAAQAVSMPVAETGGLFRADFTGLVDYLVSSEDSLEDKASVFHRSVCAMAVAMTERISSDTGIRSVVLSGGVFQNRIMLELLGSLLVSGGFRVYSNSLVPANDGGLALGQAWAALSSTRRP